jgi:hypothetical protein
MIACRAEMALVGTPNLVNDAEACVLVREFVSSADLQSDDAAGTLTVHLYRMATPAHDRVVALLLTDLTEAAIRHPETGHSFIYQVV